MDAAGANRHDAPLLEPMLVAAISQLGGRLPDERTCHLDAARDCKPTRQTLAGLDFHSQIARTCIPASIEAAKRWPSQHTNSWMNGYSMLRRMTDRNPAIVGLHFPPGRHVRHRPPAHPAGPHPLTLGYRNGVKMNNGNNRNSVIVAVPFDAVGELEREGLASPLPVFRGAAIDAVVTVGMDSAALVTLLQAPDSVRAFAAWIRALCARASNTIEISAKQGDRRVHLTVEGGIEVNVVADFLAAAFADQPSQS